jgi:hypothetical protein
MHTPNFKKILSAILTSLKRTDGRTNGRVTFNPLNAELNPIRHLLALVRAHHFVHVSRIRVNRLYAGIPRRLKGWKCDLILTKPHYTIYSSKIHVTDVTAKDKSEFTWVRTSRHMFELFDLKLRNNTKAQVRTATRAVYSSGTKDAGIKKYGINFS